ncbi:MAG: DUF4252 domain-containing protein [Bacteroidota bacterium]
MMKSNIFKLTLWCALLPSLVLGQVAFEQLKDAEHIGTVTISKSMLDLVSNFTVETDDQETKDFLDIAKRIRSVKLFMTEQQKAAKQLEKAAMEHVQSAEMERLMTVQENGAQMAFYVSDSGREEDHVDALLLLVTEMDQKVTDVPFESILVSMEGDIDLTKVGSLVEKMGLYPGLAKVGEQ